MFDLTVLFRKFWELLNRGQRQYTRTGAVEQKKVVLRIRPNVFDWVLLVSKMQSTHGRSVPSVRIATERVYQLPLKKNLEPPLDLPQFISTSNLRFKKSFKIAVLVLSSFWWRILHWCLTGWNCRMNLWSFECPERTRELTFSYFEELAAFSW